jgi:uncharacterized protein (DUF1015 family)
MPQVQPFRAITYAPGRYASPTVPDRIRLPDEPDGTVAAGRTVSDLSDVACPPYDVIDAGTQQQLLDRDPHNAIRLELPRDPDPHAAAAEALAAWLADGTLGRRPEASVYYYAHASAGDPDDPTVQGVLARVQLEPFGAGVQAHEHTMPGPKADRLEHLRVTRTQFSPILAVYFDRSERYRHVMSRPWATEWRARDGDGLLHTAAEVEADDRLLGYLARQRLFIADGHHRYETALAYQAEVRADPAAADAPPGSLAADWIAMVLVNAEMEELDIRPTHRLLLDVPADGLERLARGEVEPWAVEALDPAGVALETDGEGPAFVLLLPGRAVRLTAPAVALQERLRRERLSTAVARLDLAALHASILGDALGIDAAAVAEGERLAYTRSAEEARRAVDSGRAQAAILVRPTRLEDLAAVASAGDVMPQKSTYFYPKLLTGMVFNPLED